jgi:hypothetical protein
MLVDRTVHLDALLGGQDCILMPCLVDRTVHLMPWWTGQCILMPCLVDRTVHLDALVGRTVHLDAFLGGQDSAS